jgi:ankyrin repeat protein
MQKNQKQKKKKNNIKIDLFSEKVGTPLHLAVLTNNEHGVRALLNAGANPNMLLKGHNSVTLAIWQGFENVANALLVPELDFNFHHLNSIFLAGNFRFQPQKSTGSPGSTSRLNAHTIYK